MLDFQFVRHRSPVYDLSYFFYSECSIEVLDKLDDYIEIYYSSLSETLIELGLEAKNLYSLNTLKEDWKKYCKYGFALGLLIRKLKLVHDSNLPSSDELKSNELNLIEFPEEKKLVWQQINRSLILHMFNNNYLE